MSGVQRCCVDCGTWVDQADAAIDGINQPGTGPDVAAWACLPCIDKRTDRPAFIGRRDAAPVPPGEGAA